MISTSGTIIYHDETTSSRRQFLKDVVQGLSRPQKEISCKYFYDEAGSALFDDICELDEYYLTRTELAILETHSALMADAVGRDCELIEFGSGSGRKTRLLLEQLDAPEPICLWTLPVNTSSNRSVNWPNVFRASGFSRCTPISPNRYYSRKLETPGRDASCTFRVRRSATSARAATNLLHTIGWLVGDGGGLLIGFDLDKDESIVWPAYNDRRGVSAAFNLNVLERINRELGADFDVSAFSHCADYVRAKERMEMYLVSRVPQVVKIAGIDFAFDQDELIHTEYSYKYSLDNFSRLTSRAGFRLEQQWLDPARYFAVQYLVVD